jgi:hypothetical protein
MAFYGLQWSSMVFNFQIACLASDPTGGLRTPATDCDSAGSMRRAEESGLAN